ncbi:MAG TPA: guanitoxin biosynthesis L-enduracididine beta-hydroxylase GntD [Pyrinomonadaceae bacterium]
MNKLSLSHYEIQSIESLLHDISSRYHSVDDLDFLLEVSFFAHELPRRLRRFLTEFKLLEPPAGVCLISGYPINQNKIGSTPSHWNDKAAVSRTLEEEMLFILCASLLGEPFGWVTQQDGHIIHEVLPIKEYAQEQISVGSEQTIWWHNEDAFHPYRGDYVGLMCLRNPDNVATTVAPVDAMDLEHSQFKVLFEPRFTILPDKSHQKEANTEAPEHDGESLELAFQKIAEMGIGREKVPILIGTPDSYYIRIDPYFMDSLDHDEEARAALDKLVNTIDERLNQVVLQPGDICFIDNYKAVHGRESFRAKYDGTDRWLKRINITRDLRKSRGSRSHTASRLIA